MAEQGEEVLTMEEIFQEQALLEEEAESKLQENWGDEKYVRKRGQCSHCSFRACTYDKGYIKQPVYACLTCSQSSTKQVRIHSIRNHYLNNMGTLLKF